MSRTLLLCLAVATCAAVVPNATAPHIQPTVNISFIKEVTLSVAPQDVELTPQAEQDVSTFLESALRLLDPIMRFFDGLSSGWTPQREELIHA